MYLSETIFALGDKFINPICLTNISAPDQPLIYVNKAFRELTHYSNDFLIGRNCRFLQGPKSDKAGVSRIREAIRGHLPICQDLINYKSDGEIFYNRLILMPFKEQNLQYYIGVQNVIHENKFKSMHDLDRMFLEDKVLNPLAIIVGQHMMELPEMEKNLAVTFIRIRDFVDSL